MYDVLIVGGGPAGCSAALTLRQRGKSVLMAYAGGGALEKAAQVENYPGLPHLSGAELLSRMRGQAREAGVEIRESLVQRVLPLGAGFSAMLGNDIQEARGIIIATGTAQAALLPGESELVGRGVSYCATCDGMLYRGKRVAVVGGWPEAVEEANFLSTLAEVTYYVEKPHAVAALGQEIHHSPLKPTGLTEQAGKIFVETEAGSDPFDGVFILRPAMALSQLMPELETREGHILTHDGFLTSVERVCVAGDAAGAPYQIAKAVGDGNAAALALNRMLDKKESI